MTPGIPCRLFTWWCLGDGNAGGDDGSGDGDEGRVSDPAGVVDAKLGVQLGRDELVADGGDHPGQAPWWVD